VLCNGQALSRTTFSSLFAVIGTIYGAGDGLTTFNVPNFSTFFPGPPEIPEFAIVEPPQTVIPPRPGTSGPYTPVTVATLTVPTSTRAGTAQINYRAFLDWPGNIEPNCMFQVLNGPTVIIEDYVRVAAVPPQPATGVNFPFSASTTVNTPANQPMNLSVVATNYSTGNMTVNGIWNPPANPHWQQLSATVWRTPGTQPVSFIIQL
jgi:hypothetical protein